MRYGWAHLLRQCQNGPHTANKSGISLGENSHNKGRGTRPSVMALKALLGLE